MANGLCERVIGTTSRVSGLAPQCAWHGSHAHYGRAPLHRPWRRPRGRPL